ncbi:hypothetical protein KAW18_16465 [candidate division WOR-3 bacterium]|nr:hypothetical protein [candidate division WOR-3 bacterium]
MSTKEDDKLRESLEERGHSLLIVDLLRLPSKFSFKRYRIDLIGFIAAWILVFFILLLTIWLAKFGGGP